MADSLYLNVRKMLRIATLYFNLIITLFLQIPEVYTSTFSPLGNEKPVEKSAFIQTTSETYVILEYLRTSSSKEFAYGETNGTEEKVIETNGTEEKVISNPSSLVTTNVHHTQRFIAMTSPSIHHKINSMAPPSTENNFLPATVDLTLSSSPFPQELGKSNKTATKGLLTTTFRRDRMYTGELSSNPVARDCVTAQYVLTESTGNNTVCNHSEYNKILNKINTLMNSLKKKYFNTQYYRNELKTLCAHVKYLSSCSNNTHSSWKVFQEDYNRFRNELYMWKILLKYIDPLLYAIIIITGVGGNAMLVIIFVRHPVILTSPNIVVLIIAICDIIALLIIAPLDYLTEFYGAALVGDMGCRMYIYLRLMIRSITELCLVILSGQRFLSTIPLGRFGTLKASLASRRLIWILMIAVCIFSSVFCIPAIFVIEFTDGTCFPHIIKGNVMAQLFFSFIFTFFVILPFPMVIFNGLTASRLGRTTREDFPHTRRSRLIRPRYRSARVIAILAIFYAFAFISRTLWDAYVCWQHLNRRSILHLSIDQVINFMYFVDSCSMPLILFFLSSVYRKLFRQFW